MKRFVITAIAAVVTLWLGLAACFSDRPHPVDPNLSIVGDCRLPVGASAVGSVGAIVAIREFRFVPDTIRVPVGTRITWINCEEDFANEPHTATSDAAVWTSELLSPGDLYERRFDEPGTYLYHCEPHPFMTATVIVE